MRVDGIVNVLWKFNVRKRCVNMIIRKRLFTVRIFIDVSIRCNKATCFNQSWLSSGHLVA